MDIAVTEADAQLLALIDRAENGDEVVLTRLGRPVARLVLVKPSRSRREVLLAAREAVRNRVANGEAIELYDSDGLPA